MEFDVKTRDNPYFKNYPAHEIKVARELASKVKKEFGVFVKAVVLFGSAAKKTSTRHDIDILVIVNDLTILMTPAAVETYRIIMDKVIADIDKRIHLTTLKFTHFWEYVRNGDPIAINILRDGVAIYDTGFFAPVQVLLYNGRIRPTLESIWAYYNRAPQTLQRSKWHIMQATLDLYWAVIDAAHAALMKIGQIPPSPEQAAGMMQKKLLPMKLVSKKEIETMKKFYTLSKQITHNEIKEMKGEEYSKLQKEADGFVKKMLKIIERKDIRKHL